MVAISYGKGVLDCEQHDKMTRSYFEEYINCKFLIFCQKADKLQAKLWIQEGYPCQNSQAAKMAVRESGSDLLLIPPGSFDICKSDRESV